MARIFSGILGDFQGKVGNVIGSRWRGISYILSLPSPSGKEPSEKQLAVRLKFGLASAFVHPIRSIVNLGFMDTKITDSTAAANLIGSIINTAIIGTYPELKIDYSKVILSKGGVPSLKGLGVTANSPSEFILSWAFTAGRFSGKGSDKVLAVVYDDLKKEYLVVEDATRVSKQTKISITEHMTSDSLHVWVFCIEESTNEVSDSQYMLLKRS